MWFWVGWMLKKVGKFVMKSNENGKKIESIENCNKFFQLHQVANYFTVKSHLLIQSQDWKWFDCEFHFVFLFLSQIFFCADFPTLNWHGNYIFLSKNCQK